MNFKTLFDYFSDALLVLDTHLKIIAVNNKACKLLNYTRDELLELSIYFLFPPEFVVQLQGVAQFLQLDGKIVLEIPMSKRDGTQFSAIVSISVIDSPDGRFVIIAFQEHTGGELTREGELSPKLQIYAESILNTIKDPLVILDSELRVIFANQAFHERFKISLLEIAGRLIYEIGRWKCDVQELKRLLNDVLLRGKYLENFEVNVEFLGTYERILSLSARRIYYEGRETEMILVHIDDITERRMVEEKIREQAELLNVTADAICVCDMNDRILFLNKGAMNLYGWKGEEVIGKKAWEVIYKEPIRYDEIKKAVLSEGKWEGELRSVTGAGKEVILFSRWTLVRDDKGKPKSILIVSTDITEKKKLESQFLRAQRMETIGMLASGVVHDLNNILSPIIMALQMLRMRFTDEKSRQLIDSLEVSAQRGANLVRQILSFVRGIESKRTTLQIKHLVKEIEKMLRETFPRAIEIKTNISSDLWPISGDPVQLHQVLMNLCVNARDAMPEGGVLTISAENFLLDESYAEINIDARIGPYIVISVSDTGTGISPEIIDKIFDPFFTTKEPGRGTGLGLSTVYSIVKAHGGFINVYSELGKGTTFKIYLPAVKPSEERRDTERQVKLEKLMGHGELVLVVDDEAYIREITKATLETYGYRVITAKDGMEAVEIYIKNRDRIKVILLDMVMPLMDGSATIQEIRKVDPNVKIIAVSGLTSEENMGKGIEGNVQAFLAKPYTSDTLLKTLSRVIQGGS
jgi:hypothetical protein